jgi:hypothetical protein
MRRYDGNAFQGEDPVCGMREGHKSPCLSEGAYRRKLEGNKRRVQDARRQVREDERRAA